jgi:hypothetical protein
MTLFLILAFLPLLFIYPYGNAFAISDRLPWDYDTISAKIKFLLNNNFFLFKLAPT